jgi:hypothetical protein
MIKTKLLAVIITDPLYNIINMKRLLLIAFTALSINAIAQTNTFPSSGNVGIGITPSTEYPLQVYKQTDGLSLITVQNSSVVSGSGSGIRFYTLNNGGGGSWWSNIALKGDSKLHFNMELKEDAMIVDQQGRVGIGTTTPDQKLTVKGKIHAEEVIVDLNVPVADYVFKPNYKLMPLPEVEQFVKTNSHLPEIPSANEISKNGLSMGEMQNKLLQKVEELTLYMIEQNKSKKKLEKKYNDLLSKVNTLTKQMENK